MPLDQRILSLAQAVAADVKSLFQNKQDKLNSGENIKTINGEAVLGGGNLEISVGVSNLDAGNAASVFDGSTKIDCGGAT